MTDTVTLGKVEPGPVYVRPASIRPHDVLHVWLDTMEKNAPSVLNVIFHTVAVMMG